MFGYGPRMVDELEALRAENSRLRLELGRLALAEERFRILFEHSFDAHLIIDDTGIADCNAAALAMLRCPDRDRVRALHPAVLSPERQPDGRLSLEKSVEMDALAQERGLHRFEWIHRRMDGEDFLVEVTLTPVRLPTGPVLLVAWHELTEQRAREAELCERVAQLARQEQVILRLTTPIITVGPGVLLVPIVGALDRDSAATMTTAVLQAIADRRARTVIIDLTGVEDLDADTLADLVRTGSAASLLGAAATLTGISPALARTLVALDADLSKIRTTAVAEHAIAEALHHCTE